MTGDTEGSAVAPTAATLGQHGELSQQAVEEAPGLAKMQPSPASSVAQQHVDVDSGSEHGQNTDVQLASEELNHPWVACTTASGSAIKPTVEHDQHDPAFVPDGGLMPSGGSSQLATTHPASKVTGKPSTHLRMTPTVPSQHGPTIPSNLPLSHCYWSKKQSQVALSPSRLLHIPRNMIEESMDVKHILANGINIQIEADGVLEPMTITASIGMYKNSTGHQYYRILGFKPVCRKYQDWVLMCWSPVDATTVRMCICWPRKIQGPSTTSSPKAGAKAKAGAARKRSFDSMAASRQSSPEATPLRAEPNSWNSFEANPSGGPVSKASSIATLPAAMCMPDVPVAPNVCSLSNLGPVNHASLGAFNLSMPSAVKTGANGTAMSLPSWTVDSTTNPGPVGTYVVGFNQQPHWQADNFSTAMPPATATSLQQMMVPGALQTQPGSVCRQQLPAGYVLAAPPAAPQVASGRQVVLMQNGQQQQVLLLVAPGRHSMPAGLPQGMTTNSVAPAVQAAFSSAPHQPQQQLMVLNSSGQYYCVPIGTQFHQ